MQYKNSRYKISLGTSHMQRQKNSGEVKATCNVKIAEEALYKVLVTCIKETTGKEFHKVQAAWNVKASERGFHKYNLHAIQKLQEQEIAR